jgi:hypothetical protein
LLALCIPGRDSWRYSSFGSDETADGLAPSSVR